MNPQHMPRKPGRSILDIVLSFGRQFLAGAVQLGIVLIISRAFGAEGAGSYAIALLTPTLLSQLLNLGIPSANIYFVASRQFEPVQAWAASRDVMGGMAVLGLCIGYIVIRAAGHRVFPAVPEELLFATLLIYPFSLMTSVISSLFLALQDFRKYNLVVLLQPVSALVGIAYVWYTGKISLLLALQIVTASHAAALLFAMLLLGRVVPVLGRAPSRLLYLRTVLAYGMQVHFGNILQYLSYRLDLYLVNLLAGPAAAGLYGVAVRLVEQLWMVSQAVSTVAFPKFSAMTGNDAGRRTLTPLVARTVLWVTLLAAATLALVASPLLQVLFGPEFVASYPALLLMLPGVVLLAPAKVLANDLAARGFVGTNLVLAIFILLVNTIANLLLIPQFGILGAAAATTGSYILNLILQLILGQKRTDIRWYLNLVPRADDFKLIWRTIRK